MLDDDVGSVIALVDGVEDTSKLDVKDVESVGNTESEDKLVKLVVSI